MIYESRLSKILIDAELPLQILSRRFHQYLFFDSDISSSESMILAIQEVVSKCFGLDVEVDVYAGSNRRFVTHIGDVDKLKGKVIRVGECLRDAGDFGGLILLDTKMRWIAYQSRPVDVGIFAIDNGRALEGFEAMKENFFDCSDISGWLTQRTARDADLVQGFGAEFLAILVQNYQ